MSHRPKKRGRGGHHGGIIRHGIDDRTSYGGRSVPSKEATLLWIAPAKPNHAVTLVLSEVPEGSTAKVVTGHPTTIGSPQELASRARRSAQIDKVASGGDTE